MSDETLRLVVVACITAIPPTLAAIGAVIIAWIGKQKVEALQVQVDGRLSQLLESVKTVERMAGHQEGVEAERIRPHSGLVGEVVPVPVEIMNHPLVVQQDERKKR